MKKVKPVHVASGGAERIFGWLFFLLGCYLLWAGYKGRGSTMPWWGSIFTPLP